MRIMKGQARRTMRVLTIMTIAATLAACRDGVAPFTPDPIPDGPESPRQLTFSVTPDRNPTWSAGSDTVYYSGAAFFDHPRALNSLVRIARSGGIAQLMSTDIDPVSVNSLVLPILSPTHERIAYVRIGFINAPAVCSNPATRTYCIGTEPQLATGSVNVRPVGATNRAPDDHGVAIPFQGVDPARLALGLTVGPFVYNQTNYPYQVAFAKNNDLLFRPTWAPDGKSIAFSDGLMLHLWNTVDTVAPVIPNTLDGVSPAWSPTDGRIAFARILRGDSTVFDCGCFEPDHSPQTDDIPVTHRRRFYHVTGVKLTVINADGTGVVELADGSEPAWSPDGRFIYYAGEAGIYRISPSGGTPVRVAGTDLGRSPSVSPDGKWLAFAKYSADDVNSDIWVIRIDQQ